jgi:hypothetical protein
MFSVEETNSSPILKDDQKIRKDVVAVLSLGRIHPPLSGTDFSI